MRLKGIVFFIFTSALAVAQDSSKVISQEFGINAVSFFKQFINNSAAATVPQLPYDFFYNIHYKKEIGLRLGGGIKVTNTETEISAQAAPRTTTRFQLNLRVGLSHDIAQYKRLTVNIFGDYIYAKNKNETSTTVTVQTFPDPIETINTKTSDVVRGEGAQAGLGIKLMLYKHLYLYAESPLTFLRERSTSEAVIKDTGTTSESKTYIKTTTLQFYVPTTIYVLLRF